MAELDDCQHVDEDLLAFPGRFDLHKCTVRTEPGIVDEQVDRHAMLDERRLDSGDGVWLGEIEWEHHDLDPVTRPEFTGERVQAVGVAGDKHEIHAPGGKFPRERRSYA